MKVFLIGYMGSGKSTVGRKLAERLGMAFLDFDEFIERKTGKTISRIFESQGESGFRALEHQYLREILGTEDVVISLGGGTPCFNNNMELINTSGTSVYIETGVDTLAGRLIKAKRKRPLIQGMDETELRSFIKTNLEKREPFYRQAQYSVSAGSLNVEQMADAIAALLR